MFNTTVQSQLTANSTLPTLLLRGLVTLECFAVHWLLCRWKWCGLSDGADWRRLKKARAERCFAAIAKSCAASTPTFCVASCMDEFKIAQHVCYRTKIKTNKWSKQFDIKQHHRRTGWFNHIRQVTPIRPHLVHHNWHLHLPDLVHAESLWVSWSSVMSRHVLSQPFYPQIYPFMCGHLDPF